MAVVNPVEVLEPDLGVGCAIPATIEDAAEVGNEADSGILRESAGATIAPTPSVDGL